MVSMRSQKRTLSPERHLPRSPCLELQVLTRIEIEIQRTKMRETKKEVASEAASAAERGVDLRVRSRHQKLHLSHPRKMISVVSYSHRHIITRRFSSQRSLFRCSLGVGVPRFQPFAIPLVLVSSFDAQPMSKAGARLWSQVQFQE